MQLTTIQAQLQALYDLQLTYDVNDFLVTDAAVARQLGGTDSSAEETLFVAQDEDNLDLSLFVDAAVLDRLAQRNPDAPWSRAALNDWWLALEGVSHFLCVVWRAERNRSTTALELELQAEIDKFLLTAATLGQTHGVPSVGRLQQVLFRHSRLRSDLSPGLHQRYRRANRLAEAYCHQLQRRHQVWPPNRELLNEIRRFYRFDCPTKERHIRRLS